MTMGDKIKNIRKEKHISQKALGEKLGVSAAMIGQYETGLRNPKLETLEKIAAALEIPVWKLLNTELPGYDVHYLERGGLTITDEEGNFITGEAAKTMLEAAENAKDGIGINTKELIHAAAELGRVELENIGRLRKAYVKLNETGQKVAAERVEELAAIPKYTDKK